MARTGCALAPRVRGRRARNDRSPQELGGGASLRTASVGRSDDGGRRAERQACEWLRGGRDGEGRGEGARLLWTCIDERSSRHDILRYGSQSKKLQLRHG